MSFPFRPTWLLLICIGLWSCQDKATGPRTTLIAGSESNELATDLVPARTSLADALPPAPARVLGIQCTDFYGNDLGAWGNPSYHGVTAYPNPTTGIVTCEFTVIEFTDLTIFIEAALGPGQPEPPAVNQGFAGADLPVAQRPGVAAFTDVVEAGQIQFLWDGRDANGHDVPAGYYRVYIVDTRRGNVGWCDILIVRQPGDLPPEMPHQFYPTD